MIRELKVGTQVVALLLDTVDIDFGAYPVSDQSAPLQAVMMKRETGYVVSKHAHRTMERVTHARQKAIVVVAGEMLVTVCTTVGVDAHPVMLKAGQCLYLVQGGYKIEMQTDCKFFEFKNGPHIEDKIAL